MTFAILQFILHDRSNLDRARRLSLAVPGQAQSVAPRVSLGATGIAISSLLTVPLPEKIVLTNQKCQAGTYAEIGPTSILPL